MNNSLNLNFQEKRLLKNIVSFSEAGKKKIIKACQLAKKYHSGQKRDEGGPYILHPLRVASLLIEELNISDVNVICAALLHDAVEDSDLQLKEINEIFGNITSNLVKNLTRKKLPDEAESNKYQRKYQKFLETMKKDFNTRAIKTCDALDNMVSWPKIIEHHSAKKKMKRWLREAKTMYIPLAQSVEKKLADKMKKAIKETIF
jgi:GTP pyrophosphokinase